MSDVAPTLIVIGFAVITGANDGATLLAINMTNPAIRLAAAVAILSGLVVIIPLLGGTYVAETIAGRLVTLTDRGDPAPFAYAVVAAVAIVLVLSARGLPTSLTLALIGAMVGAAASQELPVSWTTVAGVLLIGLVAPLASFVIGLIAVRAIVRSLFGTLPHKRIPRLRRSGCAAYLLQSLAYAANDGQKMLAIAMLLLAAGPDAGLGHQMLTQAVLGVSFAVGTLVGFSRVAGRVNQSVAPARAVHSIASESAAGVAVLMSSALGTPVSMTQASTAALIGAGIGQPGWHVRWMHAVRIVGAWLVTLPAAATAGALVALAGG